MAPARRPIGFALHALLALCTSAALMLDCSRTHDPPETLATSETLEAPEAPGGEEAAEAAASPASPAGGGSDWGRSEGESKPNAARSVIPLNPGAYGADWQETGFGGWYIAPKKIRPDYFDIIFHFHAGRAVAKEYRAQARGAVIVSLTYGMGSKAYADAFSDPEQFLRILGDMETRLRERTKNPNLRARRISLFAWSAGYGAIRQILSQGYYDRIDTVVLLDGLHANYIDPRPLVYKAGAASTAPPAYKAGAASAAPPRRVNGKGLDVFMSFAQDAAAGKKEFVVTHSSIVPPGYASTTETAAVLLDVVKAKKIWLRIPAPRNFVRTYRADLGGFHVRGFTGTTKEAHIAQLHLVGEVLRELVVPRWTRLDVRLPHPADKPLPAWQREDKAKRVVAGH